MPRSSDPDLGFSGNPASGGGFTIFPSAMMGLVNDYVGNPIDMTGSSIDDLKLKLSSDCPIVVWVAGLGFNVHAICLTGYDENGVYYNDPWTGVKNEFITYGKFLSISKGSELKHQKIKGEIKRGIDHKREIKKEIL
ncbi:MAG: C39 family peptidase [Clostridiales bacterium]|jgi:uncharacterized protein YvpB|nr:C39 family peptidase [Clostridiales bacterium]